MATKQKSYDQAVREIEEILDKIEGTQTGIDQLTDLIRRAADLMKYCKGKLRQAEIEVENILQGMDNGTEGKET